MCRCSGGGSERGKADEDCGRTTITQAACGCMWFPASGQEVSLSASQTSLWSKPIPLPPSPTPTPHHTQMVWIKGLHDWVVATDEILKSDSLLSLNTPRLDKLKHCCYAVETQGPIGRGRSPRSGKGRAHWLSSCENHRGWSEWKTTKQKKEKRLRQSKPRTSSEK